MTTVHDYERRVVKYEATDPRIFAREIRRLHRGGITAEHIAKALRLDLGTVLSMLMRYRS